MAQHAGVQVDHGQHRRGPDLLQQRPRARDPHRQAVVPHVERNPLDREPPSDGGPVAVHREPALRGSHLDHAADPAAAPRLARVDHVAALLQAPQARTRCWARLELQGKAARRAALRRRVNHLAQGGRSGGLRSGVQLQRQALRALPVVDLLRQRDKVLEVHAPD